MNLSDPTAILFVIETLIHDLKHKPQTVDLDHIADVLGQAHSMAKHGLNRTQAAAKVPDLQRQNEQMSARILELSKEVEKLQSYEPLAPVLDVLKRQTKGKVNLTPSYSPALRVSLNDQIDSANPAEFLRIRDRVDSDFNTAWEGSCRQPKTIRSQVPAHLYINGPHKE